MTMPNFIIIGAAKAGTSALYRYIRLHPQVYMSPKKEPHYFSFDSRSKQTAGPGDTIRLAVTDPKAYAALFDGVSDETAIGEASPTYLYVPGTAERIREALPDAKLIAILRQPVDRAYSAYMHVVRDGRETIRDFVQAIEAEPERIKQNWGPLWHYIEGGHYYEQLSRYYSVFPTDQIKVFLHDDFVKDPNAVIAEIFRYLGVETAFKPDMSAKPNVSGVPRSELVHRLLFQLFQRPNPLRAVSRKLFPEEMRWRVTAALRNKNLRRVPLDPDLRKELTERYYHDGIISLGELLERDLSVWLS